MKASGAMTVVPANGTGAAAYPRPSAATGRVQHTKARATEALRHDQAVQPEFRQAMPQPSSKPPTRLGKRAQLLHRQPIR